MRTIALISPWATIRTAIIAGERRSSMVLTESLRLSFEILLEYLGKSDQANSTP